MRRWTTVPRPRRLIAAGRRLGARGLISAGEGNLSVRLDADRLLMTPTGLRKDELAPDDLVVVWLGHPDREARSPSGHGPSSDLAIHLAVHAARPDIGGRRPRPPAGIDEPDPGGRDPGPGRPAGDGLPPAAPAVPRRSARWAARSWPIGSPRRWPSRRSRLAAAAVLLERHGAVAVGRDPAHAVNRLELVEVLCRTWRDALLIRAARASCGYRGRAQRHRSTEGR